MFDESKVGKQRTFSRPPQGNAAANRVSQGLVPSSDRVLHHGFAVKRSHPACSSELKTFWSGCAIA